MSGVRELPKGSENNLTVLNNIPAINDIPAINSVPVRDNVINTVTVRPQGNQENTRTISICETQPVTAEGVRTLLNGCVDLRFSEATDSLNRAMDLMRHSAPDVLLIDKAFGMQAILEWLGERETGQGNGQVDMRQPEIPDLSAATTECVAKVGRGS